MSTTSQQLPAADSSRTTTSRIAPQLRILWRDTDAVGAPWRVWSYFGEHEMAFAKDELVYIRTILGYPAKLQRQVF